MDTAASARRRRLRERDAAAAPRRNRQPTCGATTTPILPPIHRPQPCLLSRPLDQDRLRLQQSHLHPKPYPQLPPNGNLITPRPDPKPLSDLPHQSPRSVGDDEDGSAGDPLSLVRSMVAVCLLKRVPFKEVDSASLLQKLEADQSATPAEKSTLLELGGEAGAIAVVETALKAIVDSGRAVDLEEDFVVVMWQDGGHKS
ncbi:hypothetical protein AAC387_Pa03g3836 [Persea americana]